MAAPHWALAYLAREVPDADGACADLVRDVMAERFGREIALPPPAAGVRGRDAQIAAAAAELGVPVAHPREGDVVVMRSRGRRRALGHHVGVWCELAARPHVLHALKGQGVRLDPLADGGAALAACGLEATRVCRWIDGAVKGR